MGSIVPVRFIRVVGTRAKLRVYWYAGTVKSVEAPCSCHPNDPPRFSTENDEESCANTMGSGRRGTVHETARVIATTPVLGKGSLEAMGVSEDVAAYPAEKWPTACDSCGAPIPEPTRDPVVGARGVVVRRGVDTERFFSSPSGRPEPGDCYLDTCHVSAGSIKVDGYHGHLHDGALRACPDSSC